MYVNNESWLLIIAKKKYYVYNIYMKFILI